MAGQSLDVPGVIFLKFPEARPNNIIRDLIDHLFVSVERINIDLQQFLKNFKKFITVHQFSFL